MSWITTGILCVDGDGLEGNSGILADINHWIREHVSSTTPDAYRLTRLNEHFDGLSAPQIDFHGFALRYVEVDDFVAFLRTLPWRARTEADRGDIVQLAVNDEHDWGMRFIPVFGEAEVGTK